ncbi:MAG: hypothetical protein ACI35W_05525 [Anaeroplasmataceae bacterium]
MARSNKRRKVKTKFRITKELIILIVFIALVGLATGLLSIESKSTKLYKEITSAQTSSQTALAEDNVFSWISESDLKKKIASSEYTYVYYGSTSVTEFLDNIQAVNQGAQDYDISKVYLFSSSWAEGLDMTDEDTLDSNKQALKDKGDALGGVDLLIYPQLWVFKDGKAIFKSSDLTEDTYQQANWRFVIYQAFGNPENKAA